MNNILRAWWLIALAGGFLYAALTTQLWTSVVSTVLCVALLVLFLVEWLGAILPARVSAQRWRWRMLPLRTAGTIKVPNAQIQGTQVLKLFAHPDLDGKSGSAMRALIRWWQAPCEEVHQEIMDRDELYPQVASTTIRLLAKDGESTLALAKEHVRAAMERELESAGTWRIGSLHELTMTLAVSFCYEYVFGKKVPPGTLPLIVESLKDVLDSTAATSRRHMAPRMRLLAHLEQLVAAEQGLPALFGAESTLTSTQRAKYLQGVWFHTGAAQLMRLTYRAIACVSRDERCLSRLRADLQQGGSYIDLVLTETLRLHPGVPTTNRVTSAEVVLDENVRIPKDINVLFDLTAHHQTGHDDPRVFRPERWESRTRKETNYMPFGVSKRRCPAERFSFVVARAFVAGMMERFDYHFPSTEQRLLVGTGRQSNDLNDLCCIAARGAIGGRKLSVVRQLLAVRVDFGNVKNLLFQLVLMPRNACDALRSDTAEGVRS